MDKTLKELNSRAEKFNQEQKNMTEHLQVQKETLILKNDQRKLNKFRIIIFN